MAAAFAELNPCDFFLGYIKDRCCVSNLKTKDQLAAVINKVVGGITNEMLENIFMSFRERICDVQSVIACATKLILHVKHEGLYLILFRVSF